MTRLKIGDVIRLREGLVCWHHGNTALTTLTQDTECVVEVVRDTKVGSEDDHFEPCLMIEARVLNQDLTYNAEGAVLTFAQYGDFRPEFIQTDFQVLKTMQKSFV